ncbi:General transcription factor IIH subunit 2 [Brachionus plicatilis]|uniref:General transcription factor IIH subunit 2 n=1 Tax=Brachionus plicatilis TaxID=10195 RepID=A0A3M7T053_BRAPC|nr:General transcription factor IIH subunit 2 [Brachionus plicatilis]
MSFNIVFTYHTSDVNIAYHLVETLKKFQFNKIYLVDEQKPSNLETRYEYLKKSSVCLVLTSRNYSRHQFCMELVNFARDLNKKIFAINTCASFRPFGALGAIIAGSGHKLIDIDEKEELIKLVMSLKELENSSTLSNELIRPRSTMPQVDLNFQDQNVDVLVSYHPKQEQNAHLIQKGLAGSGHKFKLEDSTSSTTSVRTCRTLIIVMSDEYESSCVCKGVVDLARSLKKNIIPVSTKKGWKSKHWLGLVIAGKLFFRVIDRDQAFKKVNDFAPMDDFLLEVSKSLQLKPARSEREIAFAKCLEKRIEECRQKLTVWPPPHKKRPRKDLKPVKIVLNKPKIESNLFCSYLQNNLQYTVGRVFILPDTLYDNFGVPKRQKFDAMISYQWTCQDLVKKVFMNLYMKNLCVWFDVWGNMEGCTYDAMATAIECSKVIVVFLSSRYQSSANCQLEFKYAIARGKPFIFILVEENLAIEPWIKPFYDDFPKFELKSANDQDILDDGVPRLHAIAQAIRDIGFAQLEHQDDLYELSDETIHLKDMLEDALDEIDAQNGSSRFKECTRCHRNYSDDHDDDDNQECFRHRDYYLHHWVCCGQLDINSVGCESVKHTNLPREWKQDEFYVQNGETFKVSSTLFNFFLFFLSFCTEFDD